MEINQAIKSIQHNFLLSTEEKLGLMGLFQELQKYRENPLLQMKPCWKYVRQNDINMQLHHVISECREVEQAMTLDELASEFWDILQGSVTGIFILQVKYGVDLNKLFADGVQKNSERGYYEHT